VTAFATADDLASFLQLPSVDRYTAELLLDQASDAVREETGQDVIIATTTEVYDGLPGDHPYADTVFLRQVPVTAVSGVSSDGVALAADEYEWSARGVIVRLRRPFSDALGGIAVTYTHGWDTTALQYRVAQSVALQVAARAYVNPYQLDSLTVGQVTRSFPKENDGHSGRIELSLYEKRRLDILRR
jgi:hypothetical protein